MRTTSKKWYSTTEVAQLLSVHSKTVRRWIRSGRLEATRLGGHYRIRWEELQRAIEQSQIRIAWTLDEPHHEPSDAAATAWQRLLALGLA